MAVDPLLKRAFGLSVGILALFSIVPLLLLSPFVQKHALYAHIFNTIWWQDPNDPQLFGYLKNQVSAFQLPKEDGRFLYAWHILPSGRYMDFEADGPDDIPNSNNAFHENYGSSNAMRLLQSSPDSRLVISFHGNAGAVSQGWRTDAYRNFAAMDPRNVHVWTVDYRGFGYSPGTPSEQGLIGDAISTIDYARNVAGIPPERIVIVGQSLGTAVSIAVAEHFRRNRGIEFAGIVLIAPFTDIPELLLEYSLAGLIPVLSPLRAWPKLQGFFASKMTETWDSARRLSRLVNNSRHLNLHLIHAKDDWNIPWKHSEMLFHVAANATSKEGLSGRQIDGVKIKHDMGKNHWVNIWTAATGDKTTNYIRQEIVPSGGHNRVTTYPAVARAIHQAFENRH